MPENENREYVIRGTIDDIIQVLKKDFKMGDDEARYFTYVMLNQKNRNAVAADNKGELDVWYLSDQKKYEGHFLHTHLNLSFTELEKKLQHSAYTFFHTLFFTREIDLVLIGVELAETVAVALKRIKDADWCVYSRIIEQCIGNEGKLFGVSDIHPQNKDGKCDYQEDDWTCPHFSEDENCTCNAEKIQLTFDRLEEQSVIKRVGERWMLVR